MRPSTFQVVVDVSDGDGAHTTVRAIGEVDVETAPRFQAAILRALTAGPTTIDLSGITFMDSQGLGVLIEAHRRATAQRQALSMLGARGLVAKVLRVTGLHTILIPDQVVPVPRQPDDAVATAQSDS